MLRAAIALVVFCFSFQLQSAEFEAGVHYRELAEKQPTQTGEKIEVRELFWYRCPHCFSLEAPLKEWQQQIPANAELTAMPAILGDSWEFHARVYYTFEALGITDQFHELLFKAIHQKPRPLNRVREPEVLAEWITKNGGPEIREFLSAYNSFAVDTHTRNSLVMTQRYELTGVPSVAVGGKYITTVTMAGNYENFFKVIEYLIELAATESS